MGSEMCIRDSKGATHAICDHPDTPAMRGQDVIAAMENGAEPFVDGPPSTRMVCGHFEYDLTHLHPFMRDLPACILIRASDLEIESLMSTLLPLIVSETRSSPLVAGSSPNICPKHFLHPFYGCTSSKTPPKSAFTQVCGMTVSFLRSPQSTNRMVGNIPWKIWQRLQACHGHLLPPSSNNMLAKRLVNTL